MYVRGVTNLTFFFPRSPFPFPCTGLGLPKCVCVCVCSETRDTQLVFMMHSASRRVSRLAFPSQSDPARDAG